MAAFRWGHAKPHTALTRLCVLGGKELADMDEKTDREVRAMHSRARFFLWSQLSVWMEDCRICVPSWLRVKSHDASQCDWLYLSCRTKIYLHLKSVAQSCNKRQIVSPQKSRHEDAAWVFYNLRLLPWTRGFAKSGLGETESAKFCWCQGLMQLPSIADLADLEALRWHRMWCPCWSKCLVVQRQLKRQCRCLFLVLGSTPHKCISGLYTFVPCRVSRFCPWMDSDLCLSTRWSGICSEEYLKNLDQKSQRLRAFGEAHVGVYTWWPIWAVWPSGSFLPG